MRIIVQIVSRLREVRLVTWMVMLAVFMPLVLIVVPGEYCDVQRRPVTNSWERQSRTFYRTTYDTHRQSVTASNWPHVSVQVIEHGWPFPFLARALVQKRTPAGQWHRTRAEPWIQFESKFRHWGGSSYHSVSWSNRDNWPWTADALLFRPWHLLGNLLLAGLLVGAAGWVTQWRLNRPGGLLRFRLGELLLYVGLFGSLLGLVTYHMQLQGIEALGQARPLPPGFYLFEKDMTLSQRYTGPHWLRKLVGNKYFLSPMHHVYYASVSPGRHVDEAIAHLPRLPYLENVTFRRAMPLAAIPHLQRCPRLEELDLPMFHPQRQDDLEKEFGPLLSLDDLSLLRPLGLRKVGISGDTVLAEHIEQIAQFPGIQEIKLGTVTIPDDELETIRAKYPDVKITEPLLSIFAVAGVNPPRAPTLVEEAEETD